MLKVCSKCGKKEEHNKGQTQCKKCYKEWYANYKDTKKRDAHYKNKYGISLCEYNIMLVAQGGVCFICKQTEDGRYKSLAVDHNHFTGKVRGLLCSKCNRALGLFQDSRALLQEADKYLKEND